jgi:hypothetical protein
MKKRKKRSLLERAALVAKRLRRVKGIDEIERTFCALGLAASPEERWEINRFWVSRLPLSARKAMEQGIIESADFSLKPCLLCSTAARQPALEKQKAIASLRRQKGHDIDAACGQLRLKREQELAMTRPD